MSIHQIEIAFPVAMDLTPEEERAMTDAIGNICDRYEREHPGRKTRP
ncbi:MAG: hypothetical protein U1E40_10890 [Amaricoccus sp.]